MGKLRKAVFIFTAIVLVYSSFGQFAWADSANGVNANAITALTARSEVLVDGKSFVFPGYNIEDSNYFKLRDLAMALNGTEKQFDISYDAKNDAIFTLIGRPYTVVGGELKANEDKSPNLAKPTASSVYFNGTKMQVASYNIGGYNYFKLRDVAAAISFDVKYDESSGNILVDTTKEYINPLVGLWCSTPDDTRFPLTYLLFSENGTIYKFGGSKAMAYTADNETITFAYPGAFVPYPSLIKTEIKGRIEKHSYKISSSEGQTYLEITEMLSGKYIHHGSVVESGAEALIGIWLGGKEEYIEAEGSPYAVKRKVQNYIYFNSKGEFGNGKADIGKYTYTKDSITSDLFSYLFYSKMGYRIIKSSGVTQLEVILKNGKHQIFLKEK